MKGAVEDVFDGLLPLPDATVLLGAAPPAAEEEVLAEVFAEVGATGDELDGGAAAEGEDELPAEELLEDPPPVPWNASIPL